MATEGVTSRSRLPRGVGEHFGPAAGAAILATDADDLSAVVVATPGTPVHAMCAGRVHHQAGRMVLDGLDGHRWEVEEVEPLDVATDTTVDAGAIIGHFADGADAGARLRVTGADGSTIDAAGLLCGVPDPNELGYADRELGVDVDPARPSPRLPHGDGHVIGARLPGSDVDHDLGNAAQDAAPQDVAAPDDPAQDVAAPDAAAPDAAAQDVAAPDVAADDGPRPETPSGDQPAEDTTTSGDPDGDDVDQAANEELAGEDVDQAANEEPAGEAETDDDTVEARKAAARLLLTRPPPRRKRP